MREDRGGGFGCGHCHFSADKAGDAAKRTTEVALVGTARVVMSSTIDMVMSIGVPICSLLKVLMVVAQGVHLVISVRVLGQLHLSLNAELRHWAQHACGERAPNRQQHNEQHKKPMAKRLHNG
ncbi:MAG: hypothetical protein NVS2B4_18440 [Ramlibacter sp.]